MNKNQVIYGSIAGYTSNAPSTGFHFLNSDGAFSNNDTLSSYNLIFPIVRITNASYSFTNSRADSKQLGSAGTIKRDINSPSAITLSLNYYQNGIINELRNGFLCNHNINGTGIALYGSGHVNIISGFLDRRYERSNDNELGYPLTTRDCHNIFICTSDNLNDLNDRDNSNKYKSNNSIYTYAFADCYLNSWKTSCQMGGIPNCSIDWICSNLMYYQGCSGLNIPSVDYRTNTLRSGILFNIPNNFEGTGIPTVLIPSDINLTISHSDNSSIINLPFNFNDIKIQGFNISLDLSREPLVSIGYKQPLDRRINLPAYANLDFNVIVGDNQTGTLIDHINNDKEYDINIKLNYQSNSQLFRGTAIQYDFIKAKFNGISMSESISQRRIANFSFTSELSNDLSKGFFISGQLGVNPSGGATQTSGHLLDTDGDYLIFEDGDKILIDTIDVNNFKLLF